MARTATARAAGAGLADGAADHGPAGPAGRRWALRVIWELRPEAGSTFRALQEACGGMSPTVLNERLRELRESGLLGRRPARRATASRRWGAS